MLADKQVQFTRRTVNDVERLAAGGRLTPEFVAELAKSDEEAIIGQLRPGSKYDRYDFYLNRNTTLYKTMDGEQKTQLVRLLAEKEVEITPELCACIDVLIGRGKLKTELIKGLQAEDIISYQVENRLYALAEDPRPDPLSNRPRFTELTRYKLYQSCPSLPQLDGKTRERLVQIIDRHHFSLTPEAAAALDYLIKSGKLTPAFLQELEGYTDKDAFQNRLREVAGNW